MSIDVPLQVAHAIRRGYALRWCVVPNIFVHQFWVTPFNFSVRLVSAYLAFAPTESCSLRPAAWAFRYDALCVCTLVFAAYCTAVSITSEKIKLSSVVEQLCPRVSNLQYVVTVVTQVLYEPRTKPSWERFGLIPS